MSERSRRNQRATIALLALTIELDPISAQASRFDTSGRVLVAPAIILLSVPLILAFAIKAIVYKFTKYKLKWWAIVGLTLVWGWLIVVTRFWILNPLMRQN